MTHRQAIVSKYKSHYDRYWFYHCCVHVDCPFQVFFSGQQSGGFNALSKLQTKHGRHLRKLTGMASWCCWAMLKTKQGVPHIWWCCLNCWNQEQLVCALLDCISRLEWGHPKTKKAQCQELSAHCVILEGIEQSQRKLSDWLHQSRPHYFCLSKRERKKDKFNSFENFLA